MYIWSFGLYVKTFQMAFGCYKVKDQILVTGLTRLWMICSLPLQPHLNLVFFALLPLFQPCWLSLSSSNMLCFPLPQTHCTCCFCYTTFYLFIYISPLSLFFQESLFHLSAYIIPSIRISNCHHRSNSIFLLCNPLVSLSSHCSVVSVFLGLCLLLLTIVT